MLEGCFQRPHYAAEVQDFLQNRAIPEEAQRVERLMSLIQQTSGLTAQDAPSTQHSRPRAATALGASTKQQQQLQRMSMATDTDSTASGIGSGGSGSSWLYTTTAAAASLHPASAQVPHTAQQAAAAAAAAATKAHHKPSRPASAAVATPAQHDPHSSAPAAVLPGKGAGAKGPGRKSVNITTSQAMHGLKDLNPDLWASTVPICRPDPAPNKNFISEWGESLRQGAGEAWAPYLATTSQLANLQVAKPTDEFAVRSDESLIAWVAKQQMHFADLLSPQAAAAVAALLEGRAAAAAAGGSSSGSGSGSLSLSERKELLAVMRQLAAVVQPNRAKSTSHVLHCKQTSVEEAATTALLKEQTRIRTMGFPRKVAVKGFRPLSSTAALSETRGAANGSGHSSSSSSTHALAGSDAGGQVVHGGRVQSAAASAGGSGSRRPAVRASEMIDTQKSRVPLKWAASNLVPPCSTYTLTHGAHPGRSPQMLRTKFREVNVGMGHVDQHLYPPGSQVYPVEALYLSVPAKHQTQAPDVKTTYRTSFPAAAAASPS